MDSARWRRIETIFHAASDLGGIERNEYLSAACASDDELRTEVCTLLAEHDRQPTTLGKSVFDIGLQLLNNSSSDKRTGTTISRFSIGKLLGRGGMGEIYFAEDQQSRRSVAIKFVNDVFALDPERIRRFRKEADAASRISHPNVAELYELGEIDGEHFIVMELVEGENLRQIMSEQVSPKIALDIAVQIATALVAAHSAGVVHRDIKPENVIVTPNGAVKVLDFGLAKLVQPIGNGAIHIPGGDDGKLTVEMSTDLGALIGTPAYMSPEQIRGEGVDRQTDLWSLGVLLYEMLSGHLPFTGATKIDLIAAVLVSEPAPLQLNTGLNNRKVNRFISKSLAKEKSERYQTAEELFADIRDLEGTPKNATTFQWAWKYATGILLVALVAAVVMPATRHAIAAYVYSRVYSSQPLTDGLVSHWPANGNANDVIGENNGELLNGATFRLGISGNAFSFDGVDDYFRASTNGFPTGNLNRTVTMWIQVDEYRNLEAFFGGYGNMGPRMAYELGASSKYLFVSNWGDGVGGPLLETGRWYQIAATTETFDGPSSRVSLFLDGEMVKQAEITLDTAPDTSFLSGTIPTEAGDIRKLAGAVDEIMVYDRALSPEEIHTLYSAYMPQKTN